jgi:hypothetical protein
MINVSLNFPISNFMKILSAVLKLVYVYKLRAGAIVIPPSPKKENTHGDKLDLAACDRFQFL